MDLVVVPRALSLPKRSDLSAVTKPKIRKMPGRTFIVTAAQEAKAEAWRKEITKTTPVTGPIGGHFTYCFTPTSIGIIVKLKHYKGEEIDLTDYDEF
jgi:hypothetical protein